MGEKILIVNYKAYEEAYTRPGLLIAEAARVLKGRLSNTRIILAVPAPLLYRIASIYDDVYLQHADPVPTGSYTGYTPARALQHLPATGTLVNHSEHKLDYRSVSRVIGDAKMAGREVAACADTPGEAAGLAHLKPHMIAVEPPELIGSGIPVSRAKPEVVSSGVEAVHSVEPAIIVLAGAGINGGEDAVRALQLGARGVLVASAIVKAGDPSAKLEEIATAMDSF